MSVLEKAMKKSIGVVAVCFLVIASTGGARAQLKSQLDRESQAPSGVIVQEPTSLFFGWFDPSKFSMRHSFEVSYMSMGGQGLSLSTYTNSMMYRFADNLDAQADISMSYSPSNSFSTFGTKGKDFSGIYLSRAEVNYRPWENFSMQFQYRQLPYGSYYYSPFTSPWYGVK
jgi:hypothetical protein